MFKKPWYCDAKYWQQFESSENDRTPLHDAAHCGRLEEMAKLLVDEETDVNAISNYGLTATPLHCAAMSNILGLTKGDVFQKVVLMLLLHGANPMIRNKAKQASFEITQGDPLFMSGYKRMIVLFSGVYYGFNLLQATKAGNVKDVREALKVLTKLKQTQWVNIQDLQGNTPLHYAFMKRYKKIMRILLGFGVDTTIRNHAGHVARDVNR